MPEYRIKNWEKHFENSRTRDLKRMEWVPIPNQMDGEGYTELVDHPDGAAHFGAWVAMVEIASRREIRGTLPNGNGGLAKTLARISRFSENLFQAAITRLLEIGWIEETPVVSSHYDQTSDSPQVLTMPPQVLTMTPPPTPQEGAPRARVMKGMEGKGTERNGTDGESQKPGSVLEMPGAGQQPFPEAAAAVRDYFPSADDPIIRKICNTAVEECGNATTDAEIAAAIRESYRDDQKSVGLWLSTVSGALKRKRLGRASPVRPYKYKLGLNPMASMR